MIVRSRENAFVLIHQHHHAFLSGVFFSHLDVEIEPYEPTMYAIYNHDRGWIDLDEDVLWNEEKNQPYSFDDYPLEEKIHAYQKGITEVENVYPYAGYLCSTHYAAFFNNMTDPLSVHFRESEYKRQERLFVRMTRSEIENISSNLSLLRFCDDLSLSLCLNEPTKNTHPWFVRGMNYMDNVYYWRWKSNSEVMLVPNLFKNPFTVNLPFIIIDRDRIIKKDGMLTMFVT